MSSTDDPRDTPRTDDTDRWLREALRHAPDADQPVPATLADTILRAARTQTLNAPPRPAPTPAPVKPRWLAWFDALARPQVSGAIASVMLATVLGVMWWDMPADVAMPPPDASREAATPSAPTADTLPPAPVVSSAVSPSSPTPEPKRSRQDTPVAVQGTEAPPDALRRERRHDAEQDATKKQAADTDRKRLQAEATVEAPGQSPQQRETEKSATTAQPPKAAAAPSVEPAAPPPMAVAAPPAPVIVQAPAPAMAARSRVDTRDRALEETADRADQARGGMAAAAPRRPAMAASALGSPDLQRVIRSLTADPTRWVWLRPGSDPQPVPDLLVTWLRTLNTATAGQWAPVDSIASGPTIVLRAADGAVHTWTVTDHSVIWSQPGGVWTVPVNTTTADSLRQTIHELP